MATSPPYIVFDPDTDKLPAHVTHWFGPEAVAAWRVYERLQRRRIHPAGTFDAQRRWWPSADEWRPCCERIRRPSGRWPYSLLNHCRTAGHVGAQLRVSPKLIRGIANWLAYYARMAWTAPSLCPTCGASWRCDHGFVPSEDFDPALYRVPDDRADMDKHLGYGG
jgi:hypothetical protein